MRNMDKLVVIDVEATCWENNPPPNVDSEIIEIGVCTIDLKTLEIGESSSIIIKPVKTTVSEFCTSLTTLTQADVDKGISLEEACKKLRKNYDTKNRIWASYGQYDANIFKRDCDSKNIQYPFGNFHLNIKGIIETVYGQSLGLGELYNKLPWKFEGTHHRGIDDAKNIAKVYVYYLRKMRKADLLS